jgi:60 kDa SS-A/Ro ribonucleoprotein
MKPFATTLSRLMGVKEPETVTHEGGRAFALDPWARLRRFLVLGSAGGTFYAGEREVTAENLAVVRACLALDGGRVVAEIVAISEGGRAPKQDPTLAALALATTHPDLAVRRAAYAALPRVARTGTHLFRFAAFAQATRGWGRGLRRAVGAWYNVQAPRDLAYQAIKYQQREGWRHADLLRLAHPTPATPAHDAIYKWIVDGELVGVAAEADGVLRQLAAFERVKTLTEPAEVARVVRDERLPREAVPTEFLTAPEVWEALLAEMPFGAMLRNLATLSRVGLLVTGSEATRTVVARLTDGERLRRARVHPLAVLAALKVYAQGHGERGKGEWRPVAAVVDALDDAFYAAFGNVPATGKRLRLALDVSSSMDGSKIAGLPFLTAREASAAMALVTARVEPHHEFVAYSHELVPVAISPRQRLDDVVKTLRAIPFGGTFCHLPIKDALARGTKADAFVSFTDSETWDGSGRSVWTQVRGRWVESPGEAKTAGDYLVEYREKTGIPAKHVVAGMCSNGFSLADPNDAGQLDVVGFDTAAPAVIGDFIAGEV